MDLFTVSVGPSSITFHSNVRIDPLKPIEDQLNRKKLISRAGHDFSSRDLRAVIERNASLRVDFGWSFESSSLYREVMNDCIKDVVPKFSSNFGYMMTDGRCSWLGFVPNSPIERGAYEHYSDYALVVFNNNLVDYQTEIVRFITQHRIFRQHAILRDDRYRFAYFKPIRKNPVALAEAYRYYINAVHDIGLVSRIPRDLLDEQIGCHFLNHSDLFFELLEFSILKGEVHE